MKFFFLLDLAFFSFSRFYNIVDGLRGKYIRPGTENGLLFAVYQRALAFRGCTE